MLPVLILVHVLLILCSSFGLAIGNGSGGQHNCPCHEDVPPLTQEDEVIAESLGISAKQVTTKTELKFALANFEKMPGIKVIVCLTGDRNAENDLIKQIITKVKSS